MSVYGCYKNARNASWQCLIDNNVTALPVDLLKITKAAGIKTIKNSEVNELSGNECGASVLDGNTWYIIYDDECTIGRRRFTIAHELGHIFLGHALVKGYHARTFDTEKPQVEVAADIFASRLLAPACVLWGLDIHTAEDIAKVCDISRTAAQIRSERMEVLYKRKKFLTSPLERQVFERFKNFIQQSKNN